MKKLSFASLVFLLALSIESNAQISGTKTIGTSGDYISFTAAVADLVVQGIDGPVIFNIETGTYNEQVVIPEITGASSTNTITFQSATGDSTDVVLTYAPSAADFNYTVKFDGADYIRFKRLTLKSTGAIYAGVVEIANGATFNSFESTIIEGVTGIDALVNAHSTSDDNISNAFLNNVFAKGAIGLKYWGASSTTGIEVGFNQFSNQTAKAMYVSYCYEPVINGNEISSDQPIDGIFIQDTGVRKAMISNNKILLSSGGNGIVFEFELTGPSHPAEESLIYNNFIYINTNSASYGINISPNYVNAKIYYNTIHITGNNTGSSAYHETTLTSWSLDLKNNILVNEAYGTLFSGKNYASADYNFLYTNGEAIGYSALTLEGWRDYGHGQHSIFANPYFVTATSWQVQNPLVNNAGTPVTEVTTDIDGETRDTTAPDMGADEFTPSPVPLNGTFTIGATSADYTTVSAAIEDLTINGISGPVTFNIADGTYNEQLLIQEIAGASATNTITFQSASADSTDVVLTYTPTNTTHRYTIRLDGTDYIILKNLSITTGELWGIPVEFKNEATHNQLQGNKLYKASQASFSWEYALVQATGGANTGNVFVGNYFENGNMGIYLDGADMGTQITGNQFVNVFFQGIYLKNTLSPIITGNTIHVTTTSNFSFGIYIDGSSYDGSQNGIIANNMILMNTSAGGAIGIVTPSASQLSVIYNTAKVNNGKAFSGSSNTEIINNIFTLGAGTFVAEISDTTGCIIDYNLYYQPNSSYADMYYSTGHTSNLEQYGFDLHSFSREPTFVSESDLHTTDPWISNLGTPLTAVTTDIDGDTRDLATPDVGADEYIAATLFAGEYTIGATGDFTTFTEAIDSIMQVGAIDSVTFYVQSGTYNEQFIIGEIPFVTETIPVVFKPETPGDSTVILQYAATSSDNYIIRLESTDYVTFTGFTFRALDPIYATIFEIKNEATHTIISHNIFMGSTSEGRIIYSGGNQDDYTLIVGNRFYYGEFAIFMLGSEATKESNLVIKENLFVNQSKGSVYLKNQTSLRFEANKTQHTSSMDTDNFGILITSSTSGTIANNEFSLLANGQTSAIILDNADNFNTYYNSVYIYGQANDSRCYNKQSGGQNNQLYNNILVNEAGGLAMYNTDISSFSSDNNNFYTKTSNFIYTDTWIPDLTTWQSVSGEGANSYNTNPQFTIDNSLKTSSPLLNGSAVPIAGIIIDIEGNTRDATNPDMGAYEFSEANYVLGVDTTICKNTSIIIDAGSGYDSYLWSTNATTQTIETDSVGIDEAWYRVSVTFKGSSYTDSLKVIYSAPNVDLADTTKFCLGASVDLTAGDGSNIYKWSTGSPSPSITVSNIGTYSVKVIDSLGCVVQDTIVVLESAGPVVSLAADTSFCAGDTLTLDPGPGDNYTFLWNDQSTSQTLEAINSGIYTVIVTDQYGCKNGGSIIVTENPLPNINLGDDQTICDGTSTTLDAGTGFAIYQWSDGSGSQTIVSDISGNYYVTVWDANSCTNSDTVLVTVNPPFTPRLSSSGDELQVDYQTGMQYQWYLNNTYDPSATSFSYRPSRPGDYYVIVTDEFSCTGTSNTVTFSITGIEDAARQVFQIYPNPSDGHLTIHYQSNLNQSEVIIFNARGNIVYKNISGVQANGYEQAIDLSGISKGIYLLRIGVNGQVYNQKLLIE